MIGVDDKPYVINKDNKPSYNANIIISKISFGQKLVDCLNASYL